MKCVAVLDATLGDAAEQARVLAGFIDAGLTGCMIEETIIFHDEGGDTGPLPAASPTRDVRLIKSVARRPDVVAEILAGLAQSEGIGLFVWAAGRASTEAAARLARRTRGAALTEVLSAGWSPAERAASPEGASDDLSRGAPDRLLGDEGCGPAGRLACEKNVYSGHMVGRFVSDAGPWCLTVDAGWADTAVPPPFEHRVIHDIDESGRAGTGPFEDVVSTPPPATSGGAESRFVVVAGVGAGSRTGVERVGEAARRMGAWFGVSRAVAMQAWAPIDGVVGVSGVRTAPELCVVVGASGAPALHWGIERAEFIVAVNVDEHAPIVANADAVVIGDGVAVMEALADIIGSERRPAVGRRR